MATWAPITGMPFIFEDHSSGTFLNSTLNDMYGRLSIQFTQSLSRPGRDVTMIRVVNEKTSQVPLVPNAVIDFTAGSSSGGMGTVMFPPASNVPMESYVRKVNGVAMAPGSLLCRRFLASDSQEYKWTLTRSGGEDKCVWTCSTSHTNYFVASYEQCDAVVANHNPDVADAYPDDQRIFSVGDTWVHLVVELLTSLAVVRRISLNELKFS